MAEAFTVEEITEKLQAIIDDDRPVFQQLRDQERAAGRRVILPGLHPWLMLSDWDSRTVVSVDGDEWRLVLLHAVAFGRGAFKRLLSNITSAGLTPVIVGAVGPIMPALMERWGWQCTVVGEGWETEDQWRPPSDDVLAKPLLELTAADIDRMTPQHATWAVGWLADFAPPEVLARHRKERARSIPPPKAIEEGEK